MTQYEERVKKQATRLAAEEWANEVSGLHAHSLTSMWYETNPEDMDEGGVLDIHYNDGRIERRQHGKVIRILGERLTGEALLDKFAKFA